MLMRCDALLRRFRTTPEAIGLADRRLIEIYLLIIRHAYRVRGSLISLSSIDINQPSKQIKHAGCTITLMHFECVVSLSSGILIQTVWSNTKNVYTD